MREKRIMKGKPVLYKSLVVGVIVLFIGVGVQPAVATVEPENIDVEPKDYLFQTIIDIANDPDVKNLLEKYDNDLFSVDIDRSVYRKLLLRNPRLLFNMLFTKPSMSIVYLNKCYNNGIEVTNILGEDIVLEMIENNEIFETSMLDKLNDIISKDEELSDKIAILKDMNMNFDWDYPIICSTTFALTAGIWFIAYGIALLFAGFRELCLALRFYQLATFSQEIGWMIVAPLIALLSIPAFIYLFICWYTPVP
jgi:hypothetical protein